LYLGAGSAVNDRHPPPYRLSLAMSKPRRVDVIKDAKVRAEKLQLDAVDCELISKLATTKAKRQAFARLAEEYRKLAGEMQAFIQGNALPDNE
jgi:hypothetical protein